MGEVDDSKFDLDAQHTDEESYIERSRYLEEYLDIQRQPLVITGTGLPKAMKDPCVIVKEGEVIVIGTQGDNDVENLGVLMARGTSFENLVYAGSWKTKFRDQDERPEFCAPGGIYDPGTGGIVAVAQTRCFEAGGRIELITSEDGIKTTYVRTLFKATPDTPQAVMYDPHLFRWNDEWWMSLNIGPRIRESAIYVASSIGSWWDKWNMKDGPVFATADCPVQAQQNAEWNIEGSNVGQIGNLAVMVAAGFVEAGKSGSTEEYGTKQRVIMACANNPWERFVGLSLPLIDPRLEADENITETGHPSWVTDENGSVYEKDGRVFIAYQGRNNEDYRWCYFLASMSKAKLIDLSTSIIEQTS